MALPHILKDFNLFGDGNNWQGQIPSLTLPELARRMVEYEGGGMDGPIEVCLLYTSPSPRDLSTSRMPSSA